MDSRLLTYKTWKPMPESTNLFTRLLSQLVIGFLDGKNLMIEIVFGGVQLFIGNRP